MELNLSEHTIDVIGHLKSLVSELEHFEGHVMNLDTLRAQVRALEAENEALRDLIYDLGITCADPENMNLGERMDIRRAIETAGVL